ncbi:MAG: transporter [Actinomycetes bacterium]
MTWLTWRQLRTQTAVVYAAVAAALVLVLLTGPKLADLARGNANIFDLVSRTDRNLFYAGIALMAVVPAVIGAFWGAPMVARELETGTYRLVWAQSVTRTRWLATKLGLTTAAAVVAVGLLSWAVTWWSAPLDGALSSTHGGLPARLTPVSFAMRGLDPVAWTVFALVLGVAVGLVLRRSLPAIAVTLALVVVAQVTVPLWVRPHLAPPVTKTVTFSTARDGRPGALDSIVGDSSGKPVSITVTTGGHGDWVIANQTLGANGRPTSLPAWLQGCLPGPPQPGAPQTATVGKAGSVDSCLRRLTTEGYRQRLVYQPASRFWALQWVETGLLLVVSGLLAAFSFWWTRRRLT